MNYTYTYDGYYNYQQITDVLTKYQEEQPNYVRLSSMATTPEGRNIWLMEVTDLSTGGFEDKPAIYVEGNIHAGEVTGCMSVMYFLDTIFTNIDTKEIQEMLKNYTVYAVPRVSPDGSEHYLTTPITVRSAPRDYMYTSQMPGLVVKDMDNDGVIRLMRIKTDYGIWKVSELDSRLMTKRLPEDIEGEFYNLYDEGEIIDYDGINIVDAPVKYGNDFNRNYPFGWEPNYKQRGAGIYPLANVETKANADFLLSHPNICFVLDMHTAGGLNFYTPAFKARKDCIKDDVALNKAIAKLAERENKYPAVNIHDEHFPKSRPVGIFGSFCDFCHFMVGVPNIAIECWDLKARAGMVETHPPKEDISDAEKEDDAFKILKWVDANVAPEEGFIHWTAFEHPQLGTVEIGGYNNKYIRQNPPKGFLHQEVEKHTRFMHSVVKTFPRVCFDDIKATNIEGDVYKIEAIVGNKGYMPTYALKESLKNKGFKELSVELAGDVSFVQGKAEEKIGHLGGLMHMNGVMTPVVTYSKQTMQLRKKVEWIVQAKKGTEIEFKCSGGRIGTVKATITL